MTTNQPTNQASTHQDLLWNIPERKQGTVAIIGGNSQSFRAAEQNSAYLSAHFPLEQVYTVLPDSLKSQLPPLSNLIFMPATSSGSFANSPEFRSASTNAATTPVNTTILVGDFSKNSETANAVTSLIQTATTPIIIARDALDLITPNASEWIEHDNLYLIASLAQLQKLFKSLYYPKMLLLTSPQAQIIEALHKFTLSYPCTIVTYHESNILIAHNGQTTAIPISQTPYTPLTLWQGQLACNIAAVNLYNPNKPYEATIAAIHYK